MEFLSFVKGLVHKFSKNEIALSCELTLDSLRKHTMPSLTQAVGLFKVMRFRSAEAKAFEANFKRQVGGGADMLVTMQRALLNADAMLTTIEDKSDALFADQEASLGLNYQKAAWLQMAVTANFANDYTRKFLTYLYVVETAKEDPSQPVANFLSPAEFEYIDKFFTPYATAMRLLLQDFKNIEKSIAAMPSVVVNEISESTLPAALGASKIDPLGLRNLSLPINISVKWNPFYLIGTLRASFQVAQYKASQEERELLQMRKINLEKLLAKTPDVRVQKEVEYLSQRVSKLNYELAKAQEDWGV